MNAHSKKKIAPIVITTLMVIFYIVYFAVLITVLPGVWRFIAGLIPLLLGAGMIYVCKERIEEINGGEEDDLSKY